MPVNSVPERQEDDNLDCIRRPCLKSKARQTEQLAGHFFVRVTGFFLQLLLYRTQHLSACPQSDPCPF